MFHYDSLKSSFPNKKDTLPLYRLFEDLRVQINLQYFIWFEG